MLSMLRPILIRLVILIVIAGVAVPWLGVTYLVWQSTGELDWYGPQSLLQWCQWPWDPPTPLCQESWSVGLLFSVIPISVMGRFFLRESRRSNRRTYGEARFATRRDIRKAGLFAPGGLILGVAGTHYVRHNGDEHVLVYAPTGSGKTVGPILCSLLATADSTLVWDIKGEIYQETHAFRRKFGHVFRFDPTEPTDTFNPLLEIRDDTEVRDAQVMAESMLEVSRSAPSELHWRSTAAAFLTGLMLYVRHHRDIHTFGEIGRLLAHPDLEISDLLDDMKASPHEVVALSGSEMQQRENRERSGILSTLSNRFAVYRDSRVDRATSGSHFNIADLVDDDRPTTLYLTVPPSDRERLAPVFQTLLECVISRLTERQVQGRRRVRFLLDEFPTLTLPTLAGALAYLRGYAIQVLLIVQNQQQLDTLYGRGNSIYGNCHVRMAYTPNDYRTAQELSQMIGQTTRLAHSRQLRGSRFDSVLDHTVVTENETGRPLLSADEILRMSQDDCLIFVGGTPPIKARKVRYFEQPILLERSGHGHC